MFSNTGGAFTQAANSSAGSGLFTQSQQSANTFNNSGFNNNAPNASQQGGSIFGGVNQQGAQGNVFGGANTGNPFGGGGNQQGQTGGSMFGGAGTGMFTANNQQQQQTGGAGSVFGQTQQTQQGTGVFGQSQNQQSTFGSSNLFSSSQPANTFNQGQGQGTGMFGQSQPQQSQVFGSAGGNNNSIFRTGSNSSQQGNVFGGASNTSNTNTNNTSVFGQFGGNTGTNNRNASGQAFPQGFNSFSNTNNANSGNVFGGSNTGGGNVFGGAPATNNAGNVFGNNNNNNASNVFGGANTNTGNNMFGGTSNAGSVFGGANNNNNNVFGNNNSGNTFGGANNNAGNVFGGNNTNTGNSVFGGNSNNNAGNIFGGGNSNNQTPFGNNQQSNSIFGGSTQPQNMIQNSGFNSGNSFNQQSSMFNKNTTQQGFMSTPNKNNTFNNATSQSFSFGQNQQQQNNSGFQNSSNNNNAFGNTSWGVPTSNTPISLGAPAVNSQMKKFIPLKPKNTKIDGKHLVKCITLLDQNTNFCKKQLKIRFIMTGGESQLQQNQLFAGTNNSSFSSGNNLGMSFGGDNNAFGQKTQQTSNLFGGSTNTFGAQQPNSFGSFNQTASSGGNTNLFGNNNANQNLGGGVFGSNLPTSGANSVFGSNTGFGANPGFGANTGFGTNNNNAFNNSQVGGNSFANNINNALKQGGITNIFGGNNTATATTSAFNSSQGFSLLSNQNQQQQQQQQPSGTGFFGNSNPAPTGNSNLFGGMAQNPAQSTQPAQGSIFGGGGGGNLFGNNSQPQNNSSFSFGASLGNTGNAQPPATGSLFQTPATQPQPQPSQSLFGNQVASAPSGNLFGSTPYQPQAQTQSQSLFSSQPQPQAQGAFSVQGYSQQPQSIFEVPQAPAPSLFGPKQPNPQVQGVELTANILSQLFSTDFFKKLITTQTTPFDQMKQQAKKRGADDINNYLRQSQRKGEKPDFGLGYSRVYNPKSPYSAIGQLNAKIDERFLTDERYSNYLADLSSRSYRPSITPRATSYREQKIEPRVSRPKTPQAQSFVRKLTPQPRQTKKEKIVAKLDQLPDIEQNYQITPSLQKLAQKTAQQLKRVPHVTIQNKYGKVVFKQSINLYKKVLSNCIIIKKSTIDIMDPEWEQKKCQLHFYNFGNYANLKGDVQKTKLENKMRQWLKKNQLIERNFDRKTGNLHVEVND